MRLKIEKADIEKFKISVDSHFNTAAFLVVWGVESERVVSDAALKRQRKAKTNFWGEIAASVQSQNVSDKSVEIFSTKEGALFRQYGGTIRPKRTKLLCFPIDPEFEGVGSWQDNRVLKLKPFWVHRDDNKPPFLATFRGRGKNAELRPLFACARKVTQKATPWWPTEKTFQNLAILAAKRATEGAV